MWINSCMFNMKKMCEVLIKTEINMLYSLNIDGGGAPAINEMLTLDTVRGG